MSGIRYYTDTNGQSIAFPDSLTTHGSYFPLPLPQNPNPDQQQWQQPDLSFGGQQSLPAQPYNFGTYPVANYYQAPPLPQGHPPPFEPQQPLGYAPLQPRYLPQPEAENQIAAPPSKRRRKIDSGKLPEVITLLDSDDETPPAQPLQAISSNIAPSYAMPAMYGSETAKLLLTTPALPTSTPPRAPNSTLTPPSSSPLVSAPAPHPPPPQAAVVEPTLCPEQAELVELIASGRNVFYTGSAGCGKSTVLKSFTKRLREMGKDVRILAPTGRAALQVGGMTTWTYAGWTPNHHKRTLDELKQAAHGKFVHKRFTETDVLVIDEISMVENLHFERLNEVLKEARLRPHQPTRAFGGLQIIVTGDFCQLPPVKPFQHCIDCGGLMIQRTMNGESTYTCARHGTYRDEEKWAFRSKAWEECNFAHVELKNVHRQSDQTFIAMLQKCRTGDKLTPSETNLLMDHPCKVHNATKLFATRDEVGRVNQEAFRKLKSPNHIYWCRDSFFWQKHHPHLQWKNTRKANGPEEQKPLSALDDHRYGECVELKKGMLVVLLTNLDLSAGLCNGSQGLVCGFERFSKERMPKAKTGNGKQEPENPILGERASLKEAEIRQFLEGPGTSFKVWPIVKFHNGVTRTIYAECSDNELGDERPYSLLCRTQVPLAPAWAMTIHKSQSLTLDRVIVNLSKAFEEGQVYVALSRATGLGGLKIEGDVAGLRTGLGGNQTVQTFLLEKFGH
ncbi:Uu.00g125250.m01.CDS01 [Anthostomella pinea]|uniref:ATP-dependent DNA helicase n=1 Tax=Anthostomella pinea TaxID=933095 RepID=A0AAI8YHP5_9PEZI|nr:Uu.00g125250.m01.CDS01 [Anthostomella pinea]